MQFELQIYISPLSSSSEKKKAISCVAFSSESEPCTAFSPTFFANSFLIVPSSASFGFVAPITSRHESTAFSFYNAKTIQGPEDINRVSSSKNGFPI